MKFVKIPGLVPAGSCEWILLSELVYESDLVEKPITVPGGFDTDLASIPRIVHPIIPVNGLHRLAAIVHDYLYYTKGKLVYDSEQGTEVVELTRKQCDQIFLEAMRCLGVAWWQRTAMYNAVRVGGWTYFND